MIRRILLLAVALAALLLLARAQEKPATPSGTPPGKPPATPSGTPPGKPPATPPPSLAGQLILVRYDLPRGNSDGFAPTRQLARRKDGPDAVDWPDFTLNGQPLWRDKSDASVPLRLRKGAEANSPFRMPGDEVIEPGGHWFRAMEWQRGRKHLYTADRTARCANATETVTGRYELWTFPIQIKGEGGPVVKNVELKANGQIVYHKAGPWRSLTLLVPASERGKPYELTVDGRGPVKFDAGLMPVKLGVPQERMTPLTTTLPGDGPAIAVRSLARPEEFPNPKEWAADVAALAQPLRAGPELKRGGGLQRYLGVEVPYSPFTIYAAALPHGMSGGFFRKGDSADGYAAWVAETGYDTIFDPVTVLPAPEEPESFEQRAAALARHGVRLGLQYDNNWNRPSLQHPNLAFLAHTLPEWHAPLYRSLSLTAQRFARQPNFAGINIGADNAGYVSSWSSAPPIPDRPWGEGMIEFAGTTEPKVPRAPSLGPQEFPFEQPVKTQAEFIKYVQRYETSFRQYGYFAEAVREVDPQLVFTTASFGSSPGSGARGGWPWASMPGRNMSEGLTTQQAYDWNDTHAAKPMHNVALADRLHSYQPEVRTWALLDNFRFLYGREAWQRACALALTRGIQGLGTNFIAHPSDSERAEVRVWQKEMNAWMRKFGGVYARTEPAPVIGVFYGHHQAVQRRTLPGENLTAEQLLRGSHEGKVTEALFLCHAAGWPARVITYQEVRRGPLPESMKAILLVGCDQPDDTWIWSPGLEPALKQFLDRGGRILADDESVCPVPFTRTDMKVAAYVQEGNFDATPLLIARNAENMAMLREAMSGVPEPIAVSESPALWAIPAEAGDTQYVTAINQACASGAEAKEMLRPPDPKATKPEVWKTKGNASLYVPPQTGALRWNTARPIYDVRLGRKVTVEEAASVDLTKDAFRWYALPPAEVVPPEVAISAGVSGFYEARPTMTNGRTMAGIPVEITVKSGNDSATIFGATGHVLRLPLHQARDQGDFSVTVTELLTGLSATTQLHSAAPAAAPAVQGPVNLRDRGAVAKFATRKHVALTIALTPEQEKDPKIAALARTLMEFYKQQGRVVTRVGTVAPGGVVESLQPLKSPHAFPQWKTIPTDLVLFGTPNNNVLLLDQARAQLFPQDVPMPAPGGAVVAYTRSPFVGEYDATNVIARDAAGIAAAVQALMVPAAAAH
ncbi:MAG: hypothetical protein QOE70_1916 [Chthoniobacter sp.]|jgi:hypothetical protein|nr:hypothetical protein [Chthoniobacter sp.]